MRWLRQDPHGPLIVFDECHRAKNLVNESGMPTKTALAVALQRAIPDARVVYCSATGARTQEPGVHDPPSRARL